MKAYQTISLKQIIILLVMIIVSYGYGQSQEVINYRQLMLRNGLKYKIGSETPYTGRVGGGKEGEYKKEGAYKDGKPEGTHTSWHENGQKASEVTYRNGIPEGPNTYWSKNGKKEAEITYKGGKPEGPATTWYENGQKKSEGTYKDGKMINEKRWDKDGNIEK